MEWIIKHIFDGEYGCEENTFDQGEPMVSVTLINEAGEEKMENAADSWLTLNQLDVGSKWPDDRNVSIETEDLILKDKLTWTELQTEHIVQDKWIDFRRTSYRMPDGSVMEPFYSYSRRDYVVIVASDTEGNYICVRQFRQGIRKVTTEFPAGGIERKGRGEYKTSESQRTEDALSAAKRELLEETGFESDEWEHLLSVPSNATIADNFAHLFWAKNCRMVSEQNLDETEFLDIVKRSADEIEELIANGGFQQAMHITAWLLVSRDFFSHNQQNQEIKIILETLRPRFSVCKVKDYSGVDLTKPFCFTGTTDEENSLVCPEALVPENTTERDDGWKGFRIIGQLDFSLIGILARISKILASNGIGIFAISTYNTDYILTKEENFTKAMKVLKNAGYEIKEVL